VKPLVILRPEPGASATAKQARAMGLEARTIPLFEIVPVAWTAPDPDGFDGILLTSANAARHGGPELDKLKGLPVHAVGAATAEAAHAAGFAVASTGDGGVKEINLPPKQRLLHLAGKDHLASRAALAIPVYEALVIAEPEGLSEIGVCVAAVHSPRAGRRLAELVADRASIAVAAISPAAAEACGEGWTSVDAAAEPSDSALLALAARLCESPRA
jgi:uroporphyrinogen-III synthase